MNVFDENAAEFRPPVRGSFSALPLHLTECVLSDVAENAVSFPYQQERNWLAAKIAQADAAGKPGPRRVMRAVRLRALLLAADNEAGWRALCEELLARETPVIMMADRAGKISQRSWPGGGAAIPVFPDESSFRLAAADLKLSLESTGMVAMKPRELFVWATEVGAAVALNVYRDGETPIYYPFLADDVRLLTEGKIPNRPT